MFLLRKIIAGAFAAPPRALTSKVKNLLYAWLLDPLFSKIYKYILLDCFLPWPNIVGDDVDTSIKNGTVSSSVQKIFLLRIIISQMKANRKILYVGFIEMTKPWESVCKKSVIKNFIRMAIVNMVLHSLQPVYYAVRYVMKRFLRVCRAVHSYTGVKDFTSAQVATFVGFMEDFMDRLRAMEPVIRDLNRLTRADETVVISTDRDTFIKKCDFLANVTHKTKMVVNYKKSGYFIINGNEDRLSMAPLQLATGKLEYTRKRAYHGALFTDSGSTKEEVTLFLQQIYHEVITKVSRLLSEKTSTPIATKLSVIRACVNSNLTHACETWGSCVLEAAEVVQRKALKLALGMPQNTPKELVYAESGSGPLKPLVYRRQLEFFHAMKYESAVEPDSTLSVMFALTLETNTPFLMHYRKLDAKFFDPDQCFEYYTRAQRDGIERKIENRLEPSTYY